MKSTPTAASKIYNVFAALLNRFAQDFRVTVSAVLDMWTNRSLSIFFVVGCLIYGTFASGAQSDRVVRLRRQNTGASSEVRSSFLPAYAKVATHPAVIPSVAEVEDAFYAQYKEHKDRLSQPIFEEKQSAMHPGYGTPLTAEQRNNIHEQRRKLMAIHFDGLRNSKAVDHPLFLDGINQLRHPTQVFREDMGASLKLGETWRFDRHGPYPALRLASLASHNAPSPHLQAELRNADHAIYMQESLDKSTGVYRGLTAYTDNLSLLKTARLYFGSAFGQRDWRGTDVEELELIGERTAKRLRL